MTNSLGDQHRGDQSASELLGKLIAEFGDWRAAVLTRIGYALGALGILGDLADVILRQPPRLQLNDITLVLFSVVVGAICFAVGKFRQKNRLVIYQHGIVQLKWGRSDVLLWRDIRQIHSERATYYGSGIAYKVRYLCSLQRWDGTWVALDAIPIDSQVMKALRDCLTNGQGSEGSVNSS